MSPPPFPRRTLRILVPLSAVSVLTFLLLLVWVDPGDAAISGKADSFSRSPVGHRAFCELLRRLGIPLTVSRYDSGRRARNQAVLVLAEPPPPGHGAEGAADLRKLIAGADRVLLVLPRRSVIENPGDPRALLSASPLPPGEVRTVLEAAGIEAEVLRPGKAGPLAWRTGRRGPVPDLPSPQLLRSSSLVPLIAGREGILAGRTRDGRITVLADPDLIENHALLRRGNAEAAVRLVETIREGTRPLLLDETLHGFVRRPRLLRELFRYPLVLALLHLLLLTILILWAGAGRFGAPRPLPPPYPPGKETLVTHTAELLCRGGDARLAVRKYLRERMREVAARFGLPADLPEAELAARLSRIGAARGVAPDAAALRERSAALLLPGAGSEEGALSLARAVHRWKKEILHGTGSRTGND